MVEDVVEDVGRAGCGDIIGDAMGVRDAKSADVYRMKYEQYDEI